LFALGCWGAWPFTVDDAFIAGRYALRLASGRGYTFSDGPPTDGITGPLWLLPLWLAARLGGDPLVAAKLLGALCSAASVFRVVRRAAGSALGSTSAAVTAVLCASSVPLVVWAVAGLETGLATLAATELALAVTRKPRAAIVRAGVSAAALAWLRPELACWVAVLLGALALRAGRATLPAWGTAAIGALSVSLFRVVVFQHWLPMAAAAKPPELSHGTDYVARALLHLNSASLALLLLSRAFVRAPWRVRVCSWALLAHGAGVVLAGGDWMPGLRLFAPVVPVAAWIGAETLSRHALGRRSIWWLAVVLCALRVSGFLVELSSARAAGMNRAQRAPLLAAEARASGGPVAALDVGALGYSADVSILDLGGLTEPSIAYARGGHLDKHVSSEWLRARAPALIVLHSRAAPKVDAQRRVRWFSGYPVERRVLAMPWVLERYRVRSVIQYAPDYHYVLLVPSLRDER
jgi:hypothetical protein